MFKKYRDFSDDEIVLMYKLNSDDDLEVELIDRYKVHCKKIAGELFTKFKFLYQVEYEDIYGIAFSCIFLACKKFKRGMKCFFNYWKKCTLTEVYDYVGQFSVLEVSDSNQISASNGEERNYFKALRQNPSFLNDHFALENEIANQLKIENENFDDLDLNIFYLYLAGYSLYELSMELNIKYATARRRLSKIKTKIRDILFNQ